MVVLPLSKQKLPYPELDPKTPNSSNSEFAPTVMSSEVAPTSTAYLPDSPSTEFQCRREQPRKKIIIPESDSGEDVSHPIGKIRLRLQISPTTKSHSTNPETNNTEHNTMANYCPPSHNESNLDEMHIDDEGQSLEKGNSHSTLTPLLSSCTSVISMDAEKSCHPLQTTTPKTILPCALEISIPPSHKKYSDSRASSDSSSESSSDNVVRDSSRKSSTDKVALDSPPSINPPKTQHSQLQASPTINTVTKNTSLTITTVTKNTPPPNPNQPNDNQGTRVKPTELRVAAQKGRSERRQAQKVQLVVKLKLNPLELDTYDLYADPILMRVSDIMIKPNTWRQRQSANEVLEHDQIGGNTQMEFGFYTKDMLVKCVHQLVSSLKHNETINCDEEDYVLFVDSGKWEELQKVTADRTKFNQLLAECPRLSQLSATHPYFNVNNFNMDVLTEPINYRLGGEFRSGSWFSLNQLMCRSTSQLPYHEGDFKSHTQFSLARLQNLTHDATRSVHGLVMPASDEKGSDNKNHQTQGSQAALNFLVTILKGLGAGPRKSEPQIIVVSKDSILIHIYEMLLGILLIYEGFKCKSDEIPLDSTGLPEFRKKGKGKSNDDDLGEGRFDGQFLINHGEEWRFMKQRCIGILALFLLFGFQGWLGCFKNRKQYTYGDIYSLFTIPFGMSCRNLSILSPPTIPGQHTPWRHLNGFVADLL
ncbi:hypothetical protein PSTT_05614 [Puccinia striiformis]|uniref:Uncharacterized protein n=1 Tax=Puccinia striiformis TaxID=27350 RepID=A0A2S4VMZ6_9BASI|nr:hypothetical protein PSTT_05614 [Puccinia striiformis]